MSYKIDYTVNHQPKGIPNPPGYQPTAEKHRDVAKTKPDQVSSVQARRATDLKLRRAWDMALAPAKQLPMQAVMLYFSGSGIQIFSLGMIFMLLTSPIGAIASIFNAFEPFRPTPPPSPSSKSRPAPSYIPLAMPMLAYVGCQILTLALGLYKCSAMGILPTGTGDWLGFETRLEPPEWSAIRALSLG